MGQDNEGQEADLELPLFSLPTIVTATDNFSFTRKLGEGGFGPVYKVSFLDVSIRIVKNNEAVFFFFVFPDVILFLMRIFRVD